MRTFISPMRFFTLTMTIVPLSAPSSARPFTTASICLKSLTSILARRRSRTSEKSQPKSRATCRDKWVKVKRWLKNIYYMLGEGSFFEGELASILLTFSKTRKMALRGAN